ncbi:putative bifunctional diguanylate cyclase/phosphodiesterase [Zavarzinia sp.]|uniref:putative bifunctional diguanylate cyclase/phosphodiesterase n=1 Tax=Zavarzinia sp. TaxID=2027920 RepID=UPI003BB52480|nr:EAL domain-containing protein [Zavarzinia sp.]
MSRKASLVPLLRDRQWLVERLDSTLPACRCCILVIKIVGLSNIEDLLGFGGRELVIEGVGRRLGESLGDTPIGHLFASEFFALIESPRNNGEVAALVGRALACTTEPITAGDAQVRVDIRVGVVFSPEHGQSSDILLSRAITALNAASRQRQPVVYFDEEINRNARERAATHAELRRALTEGQFELYFQPKAALPAHQLVGFEALLRWRQPGHGIVPPATFVPLAEETGLIREIDAWVAEQACAAIQRINGALGADYSISVNASAMALESGDYIRHLRQLIADNNIPVEWLEVEMTETTIGEDTVAAAAMLAECRALGIKVSIDDFGIGYSSLHRLRHFPVTGLKIDRSFVGELGQSNVARLIIRATIELGHAMGLEIIAEGVETVSQAEDLALLGVDVYQGYILSRPLPEAELMRWIRAQDLGALPLLR